MITLLVGGVNLLKSQVPRVVYYTEKLGRMYLKCGVLWRTNLILESNAVEFSYLFSSSLSSFILYSTCTKRMKDSLFVSCALLV